MMKLFISATNKRVFINPIGNKLRKQESKINFYFLILEIGRRRALSNEL